jgi:hypothetical protein
MEQLEIIEIEFGLGIKHLDELEPFKSEGIPNKRIIFKTLPGLGATHLELIYPRNSIIFEPFVPVIKGKKVKHPSILPVHKETTSKEIRDYLKSGVYPLKIVTTPEGYTKRLKPFINKTETLDLYKDFFVLFDECERFITDNNYRPDIVLPIDDFFVFENRAMVSATALTPSDPQFLSNGFKIIKLKPTFDYRKDLKLISTNNVIEVLRGLLSEPREHPCFIFFNSTASILATMQLLEIENESKVFCAEESVAELALGGFLNASTDLGDFARFNFLTSRFFSAVDIDLNYKPDVILVTDVWQAQHSILDPFTDVIQISGRFRRPEDTPLNTPTFKSLIHVTNYKEDLKFICEQEAISYFNDQYDAYNAMKDYRKSASSIGAKATYTQGLKATEISKAVKPNGQLNCFMRDNYVNQQRVRSYYKSKEELINAYQLTKYFNLEHRPIYLGFTDEDNMKLALAKTKKAVTEAVADLMNKHSTAMSEMVFLFYDPTARINQLRRNHNDVVEAFNIIGYDKMKELGFAPHLINEAVKKQRDLNKMLSKEVYDAVHKEFENESFIVSSDSIERLKKIFINFGIEMKVKGTIFEHYYASKSTTSNTPNGKKHGYPTKDKRSYDDR